ncbi:hypothetical protein [Arthrobacter sp. MDT1-65]
MDLAEWYVAGRWVGLLELIDCLPTACRLNEARLNDPVEALRIAQMPRSVEQWAPLVSEYDVSVKLMARMADTLAVISQQLVKSNGGKPTAPKPIPVPRTAVEQATKFIERQEAVELASRFGFDADDL